MTLKFVMVSKLVDYIFCCLLFIKCAYIKSAERRNYKPLPEVTDYFLRKNDRIPINSSIILLCSILLLSRKTRALLSLQSTPQFE